MARALPPVPDNATSGLETRFQQVPGSGQTREGLLHRLRGPPTDSESVADSGERKKIAASAPGRRSWGGKESQEKNRPRREIFGSVYQAAGTYAAAEKIAPCRAAGSLCPGHRQQFPAVELTRC